MSSSHTAVPATGEAARPLDRLSEHLRRIELPLPVEGAAQGRADVRAALAQLADHVAPRLASLDAPLLAVIGGSTGAGKSTLVNALAGRVVTRSGAIRPTTRRPLLLHHPDDAAWFDGTRILPDLARVRRKAGSAIDAQAPSADGDDRAATELELHADAAVPRGLALLDAPDIDSVSAGNRELARQLLRAADLWLFVTTANRYADAVPWELLRSAAERDVTVAVVMNRIPPREGVAEELAADLRGLLARDGLEDARLFLVHESDTDPDGQLPPGAINEIRRFFEDLAADAEGRSAIARRTLSGALTGLAASARQVSEHLTAQEQERSELDADIDAAFDQALERIRTVLGDGSLLRGEVLARWQDFVGTGELLRNVESWVGRVRDRIGMALRGEPAPAVAAENALESSLVHVVIDETSRAAERVESSWRSRPAGRALLEGRDLARLPETYGDEVSAAVRAWQGDVLQLVTDEGADRRTKARILSLGVNVVGVALMVVVFASTAFIPTGLEVGAGAGAAVVGQRLLEAIFGEDAVRRLAAIAKERLEERLAAVVDGRAEPFRAVLAEQEDGVLAADLDDDAAALEQLAADVRAGAGSLSADSPSADSLSADSPSAGSPSADSASADSASASSGLANDDASSAEGRA